MLRKLAPEQLHRATRPETVAGLEESQEQRSAFIGQERAAAALRYGLKVRGAGFHVFAAGSAGTGKETLVRRYCEQLAEELPLAPDWCYVHNYADPDSPRALRLAAGGGPAFAAEMLKLIRDIRRELKLAFRADSFQSMRDAILEELEEAQDRELATVDRFASESGFRVERTEESFVTVALQSNGEPLPNEAISGLGADERASLAERERGVTAKLKAAISRIQDVEESTRNRLQSLEREVGGHTVAPLFTHLQDRHEAEAEVLAYLQEVQADVLDRLDLFVEDHERDQGNGDGADPLEPGTPSPREVPLRYRVNALASRRGQKGAPVVFESHPTLHNLLGRVNRSTHPMEARPASFLDIKAGSLHRANGGFLVLHALDVLKEPYAWEGIKRALRSRTLVPARPREELGLETESLRPEPIDLDVVVVVLGDVDVYHELLGQDPDFGKLFTVKAHFADDLPRTEDTERNYARFAHDRCREKGLLTFDAPAVARILDEAAVWAGSQDRLSACFRAIADLLQEADYQAREQGAERVDREHVELALAARRNRVDAYEEHFQGMLERGEILIETDGARVGQVNGLAVFDVGDYVFARPSRITCTVGLGQGGLVDIEREAELGGPIHTKGVLLLRGFLLSRFARRHPLALSASLAFEQSYGLVDGDSASLAELAALLTAIARVPLRQDIAVTGSINQKGLLQAIGGVTEKVTGFFRVCRSQGLTGEQGVIVPEGNVHQLMLPREVVQAVTDGRFSVWAASDVASALGLLTGLEAGEAGADAEDAEERERFPPGTLFASVASRLREYNAALTRP